MPRRLSYCLLFGFLTVLAVIAWQRSEAPTSSQQLNVNANIQATYVGSDKCQPCHSSAYGKWQASQHAQAMQLANDQTVIGHFDNRPVLAGKSRTRYFQRDGKYWVATENARGEAVELEVTHTFGVAPLQQYLVSLPDGRKQALGLAWDGRPAAAGGNRWFHLFPQDGTRPGNPLHWSGIDQNWNYQCADCHSTDLRKGYDAKLDRFDTRWAEMQVGCEACHGPGEAHIAWAKQPDRSPVTNFALTAKLDERQGVVWTPVPQATARRNQPGGSEREIEVCARCHARRGQFSDLHRAGDSFMDHFRPALLNPGLYYPDGQQRDEVYNYGSFLQSRMHAAGVTCADCHDPHDGHLRQPGNGVCTQCHAVDRFDAATHHHHPAGGKGAACIDCHAPTTTYMGIDARHDHSFRVPRPDRSLSLGVPNACNQCHQREGARWAVAHLRNWYPTPVPGFQTFAEIFAAIDEEQPGVTGKVAALLTDVHQPAIVRASALARLAMHPGIIDAALFNAGFLALDDSHPLVRSAAIALVTLAPAEGRAYHLASLLKDPIRLVRMDAARALAGSGEALLPAPNRAAFDLALQEYIDAQMFNADRGEALANLGSLYADRGQYDAAESSYSLAVQRDPDFVGGHLGLAQMAEHHGQLSLAVQRLQSARQRLPNSPELAYAQGMLLVREKQRDAALSALRQATVLAPENPRFRYVYAVAMHDYGDAPGAVSQLKTLLQRYPNYREAQAALRSYSKK